MPRKAFVIAGCGWLFAALLTILESILNFTAPSSIFWIVPGAVIASLANRDYYQRHDGHFVASERSQDGSRTRRKADRVGR